MIRILRLLILPMIAVLGLAGLAATEWGKVSKRRSMAGSFHRNSKVVVFASVGSRAFGGRSYPTYEYEENGRVKEFPSLRPMTLPAGGHVRMGNDPRPRPQSQLTVQSEDTPLEIVVPLNGPDTVDTVYHELWDATMGEDVTKASVVSIAAVVAGVAGFFLQRIIFRGMRNARRFR